MMNRKNFFIRNTALHFGVTAIVLTLALICDASSAAVVARNSRGRVSTTNRVPVATASTVTKPADAPSAAPAPTPVEEEVIIEDATDLFTSALGDTGGNDINNDASATSLAEQIRLQRAALDAASAISAASSKSKNAVQSNANTCDKNLRACMQEKCGKNFTNCSGDTDMTWGDKMDTCRRTTECTGREYQLFAAEIKADRDANAELAEYDAIIECGNNYNNCIIEQCGATFSKCLGKTAGDAAISKCKQIATKCTQQDNGLASRMLNVFGTLRQDAEVQIRADEQRLYELRDKMRSQCEMLGAMFDERTFDCVYTINFFAANSSTPYASKKAYAGSSFDCTQNWFGVDVVTFKENAYRYAREQSSATSAMLGSGIGIAGGAITSGAIDRAIDRHKAEKALKDAQKQHKAAFTPDGKERTDLNELNADATKKNANKIDKQSERAEKQLARQEQRAANQKARQEKRDANKEARALKKAQKKVNNGDDGDSINVLEPETDEEIEAMLADEEADILSYYGDDSSAPTTTLSKKEQRKLDKIIKKSGVLEPETDEEIEAMLAAEEAEILSYSNSNSNSSSNNSTSTLSKKEQRKLNRTIKKSGVLEPETDAEIEAKIAEETAEILSYSDSAQSLDDDDEKKKLNISRSATTPSLRKSNSGPNIRRSDPAGAMASNAALDDPAGHLRSAYNAYISPKGQQVLEDFIDTCLGFSGTSIRIATGPNNRVQWYCYFSDDTASHSNEYAQLEEIVSYCNDCGFVQSYVARDPYCYFYEFNSYKNSISNRPTSMNEEACGAELRRNNDTVLKGIITGADFHSGEYISYRNQYKECVAKGDYSKNECYIFASAAFYQQYIDTKDCYYKISSEL